MAIIAAATPQQSLTHHRIRTTVKPPRPKLACFSFAAYAKTLIQHLHSLEIPILPGLSDSEFHSIESTFNFSFPPDLRSILREGLPFSPGFPNWRSSSFQQLHILLNLPKFSLLKEVSRSNFWVGSWGPVPDDPDDALDLARQFLDKVPVLVPVYRNCYVPCTVPGMAGNPVFHVEKGEIRVLSFDLACFFQNFHFSEFADLETTRVIDAPAWAATEAREIEFWTEVAEREVTVARGWWWKNNEDLEFDGLDGYLDDVFWKLREGGWREEEVLEMMDGHDRVLGVSGSMMAELLLDGGWSTDDVVYSLGLHFDFDENSTFTLMKQEEEEKEEEEEDLTFEINIDSPMRMSHVESIKTGSSSSSSSIMKDLIQFQRPHFIFSPHRNLIL